MADALKEMFSRKFFTLLAADIRKEYPAFPEKEFIRDCLRNIEELSLIRRMRQGTESLRRYLPSDYRKAATVIMKVASNSPAHYTSFLFPDFIGQYGHDDVKFSLDALKYLTRFGTSEFAIREFLKRDLKGTLKVMYAWAGDEDFHVRRLASEGCRPRLPWSFNIPGIMADPELTRPVLEKLKMDDVLYVKKSVANHLNDFSRIDPAWMLNVVQSWDQGNPHTAWIIRHASRTLIKQGNPASLSLFDYEKNLRVSLSPLSLNKKKIKLGDSISFSFDVISEKAKPQKLVIDYAIHFTKGTGRTASKVFKLREVSLGAGETISLSKIQSFKPLSTRRYYPGSHAIEILVNGKALARKEFYLEL